MNLAQIHGVIERRLLVNFRADPSVVAKLLPTQFRPQLIHGQAMVGICLIRLAQVRPRFLPAFLGIKSENAAHRFAVEWESPEGKKTGVYVRRRDTNNWLNTLACGRIFPGVHHHAKFTVRETGNDYFVSFKSDDDDTSMTVHGERAGHLPKTSVFETLAESSKFFEGGAVGYSPGFQQRQYQGLKLITGDWRVEPFAVKRVDSSFFSDENSFPKGSIEFDHALIMRDIRHSWLAVKGAFD